MIVSWPKCGRTVAEVARELDCDWHTVNDTVLAYGQALLDADTDRIGQVTALGLDETLFARFGRWRTQAWAPSIVDVGTCTLLDMVEGRDSAEPISWLDQRGVDWRAQVRYGVLDLSGPYRAVFNQALDHVTQIADPFHLVRLANDKLDECRRRVQNETLGHRGRKHDPLYRVRAIVLLSSLRPW
jgi:transposase